MAGRTLADAQADYTAIRAAWLKAVEAERVGIADKSIQRTNSTELYKQMKELDAEVTRLSRGGIRVRGGTPV